MDDLLDLFDRDARRQRSSRGSGRGLRNLLDRFMDHDDADRGRRPHAHEDEDLPRARRRDDRRRREDLEIFDV